MGLSLDNKQVIWACQHRKFLQRCLTNAKDVLRRATKRVAHLEEKLGVAHRVDEIFDGVALQTRFTGYMTCVSYMPRRARVWRVVQTDFYSLELEYDQGFGNRRQAFYSVMYGTEDQAMLGAKRFLANNEIPSEKYAEECRATTV